MEYLASVVGLSGSGKSTSIANVRNLLAAESVSSASFHDRTSDIVSAKIDSLLHTTDLSPLARMYLIIAARRQVIDRQIKPSLRNHDVTITDRYYPCTIAYQAYGEGLDRDLVTQAAMEGAQDALPNRIFLIDIPADEAIRRMATRGGISQVFDNEKTSFHERVRRGYLEQSNENYTVVDGLRPQEKVAEFIAKTIMNDLNKTI